MRINTILTETGCVLIALVGICSAGAAKANTILGTLNTTGTAQIQLKRISFVNHVLSINGPGSTQTGGWVAFAGTQATINDISNPPDSVGSVNEPNFITFAFAPNISFYFQFLFSGIDGAAGCTVSPAQAGQVCTPNQPNQSPFNLENTSATSSAGSFRISGIEVDSATNTSAPFVGTFTTPFATQSFQDLLAVVAVPNGTVTTSFAAQFNVTSPVPEPGTVSESLIGLGLVAFGTLASRVRRSKS
jgi:hypothetical protein